MQTWCICGKCAAAVLLEANTESWHFIFHANLVYVPIVTMYKKVRLRSVHLSGTCTDNAAAQCWLPIKKTCLTSKFALIPLCVMFSGIFCESYTGLWWHWVTVDRVHIILRLSIFVLKWPDARVMGAGIQTRLFDQLMARKMKNHEERKNENEKEKPRPERGNHSLVCIRIYKTVYVYTYLCVWGVAERGKVFTCKLLCLYTKLHVRMCTYV